MPAPNPSILPTPPNTPQQPQVPLLAAEIAPSARVLGQRRRRDRERAERDRLNISLTPSLSTAINTLPTPPTTPWPPAASPLPPSTRSSAQHNRHARQRNALQQSRRLHTPQPLSARLPYVDPPARHDLGDMDLPCPGCGALHWPQERLSNTSVSTPKFGFCCNRGTISLPAAEDPPFRLMQLFDGRTPQSREFRSNIRQYNAALAFTSLGVSIDDHLNRGTGPYVFRIHGELCHRIGSLLPVEGEQPTYAQLYVHDAQTALQLRLNRNSNLSPDTMELLQRILLENHAYANVYRHAFEVWEEHGGADELDICLHFDRSSQDARRYNLPTADEVAVVIPGDGEQPADSRDIILHGRGGTLRRIPDDHPAYASLHYVLLFPYGDHGWHRELTYTDPRTHGTRTITHTRFYAYQLQVRESEYSTILRGGRLLQQYIVDAWACAEQNRLRWFRFNQNNIRAAVYSGLQDALAIDDAGGRELSNLGQRFILPSSFGGGARYMHQLLQDSLAIGREFRKIDIFLTMTCNPKWPEITRELLPGQTASDRPDLTARVFRLKKDALLKDLCVHKVLGPIAAHVYTIEFQKRGLPHMHLLIFFEDHCKIRTPSEVDAFIRAQWPDANREPLLFETIRRCMVHGPCGPLKPDAPCMVNGRCSKGYPKPFQESTSMDEHGYPLYSRPDNGVTHEIDGIPVDNTWIVPYCPFLSAKYDCHINVECAVSFASLKYVNKYIYKGHDRTTLQLSSADEIKTYIDARYVSAIESVWRLFHFPLHERSPAVIRLQIHLPGQHMVTFRPEESVEAVMERARNERTTLTAFFEANQAHGDDGDLARSLTYQDFPKRFVWDSKKRLWTVRRAVFSTIGRLYFIAPTAGELFYLRTLLTTVRGPTSFENLRHVDGQTHATFREACIARGLLADDGEWRQCLEDASHMQTGYQLRQLFTTILIFCAPTTPATLWTEFRHHICDDLRPRVQTFGISNPTEDDVHDFGLFLLQEMLSQSGHTLSQFGMPEPARNWQQQTSNRWIAEQLNYDRTEEQAAADATITQLNSEQAHAFTQIIDAVRTPSPTVFFLSGYAGSGKTFLYQAICHQLRSEGRIVLCVASSGIASLLLPGGRTAHSTFKIPIDGLTEESICSIAKESGLADMIRMASVVIWDEITMQHRHVFEAADRTFRDIRNNDLPFGGISVIFGGDFQQTLPVVVHGRREDVVAATLQRSFLWPSVKVLRLTRNMRLSDHEDAPAFAQWLLDIGHGRLNDSENMVSLPQHMHVFDVRSLTDAIYPSLDSCPPPDAQYFNERIILAARNADVRELNNELLNNLYGADASYMAADSFEPTGRGDQNRDSIPPEFLRLMEESGLPPGELRVKVGCPLILLRNLAPHQGLCNGTRMTLLRSSQRVLQVKILNGSHKGNVALIPRITTTSANNPANFSFILHRRQFPVRLAFAMSINKAQGQSVKWVGIDLRVPVFTHGQLYVALSRATSPSRIKVLLPPNTENGSVLNVVYPEVLL